MDKINIRRASADDFEAISSIVLDSFVSEIHGNIKELEDTNITDYNKFCEFYCSRSEANIPFVIYIAEVNDKIIGAASGAVDEHHWGSEKWGSEDFWFVKKEYRGRKAGLLLFDKLMNWFKEYAEEEDRSMSSLLNSYILKLRKSSDVDYTPPPKNIMKVK